MDILVVAVLVIGMYLGYRRGLVRQLVSLTGWLIAYVAAFLLFDDVAAWIAGLPLFEPTVPAVADTALSSTVLSNTGVYVTRAIAFALLFFGMKAALSLLGWVLHAVASLPMLRTVNRTGGMLLALVETVVIVVIALLLMQELPSERAQAWTADSWLFTWLKANTAFLPDNLHGLWNEDVSAR